MKNYLLTLAAAVALSAPALAQTSAVTDAILNQRSGLYDKARTAIDKAALNEKTSAKAKTWYTRGEIYELMMDSPIFTKQLQPGEGTQKAFESYNKAIELDGKTGEYGAQAFKKMENVYGRAFNEGVNSYNAKDYDKAITSYKLASQIKPTDTTVVLYSALAYENKQDIAGAKASYNQLLGMGYKSPAVYSRLLQFARQDKNEAEAAKIVQAGLAAYPGNKAFMLEDLNMTMSNGSPADAIAKISKTIQADPGNSNLYAVRGSLYDQQISEELKKPKRDAEKVKQLETLALADYRKSVELDPTNFDSQFNLGVHAFNHGADSYKKLDKLDLKAYQGPIGKAMQASAKKNMDEAIPYFEKALLIHPADINTLSSLRKAYSLTGNKVELERISEKEIGPGEEQLGPRGGHYYITKSGNKVYYKK